MRVCWAEKRKSEATVFHSRDMLWRYLSMLECRTWDGTTNIQSMTPNASSRGLRWWHKTRSIVYTRESPETNICVTEISAHKMGPMKPIQTHLCMWNRLIRWHQSSIVFEPKRFFFFLLLHLVSGRPLLRPINFITFNFNEPWTKLGEFSM